MRLLLYYIEYTRYYLMRGARRGYYLSSILSADLAPYFLNYDREKAKQSGNEGKHPWEIAESLNRITYIIDTKKDMTFKMKKGKSNTNKRTSVVIIVWLRRLRGQVVVAFQTFKRYLFEGIHKMFHSLCWMAHTIRNCLCHSLRWLYNYRVPLVYVLLVNMISITGTAFAIYALVMECVSRHNQQQYEFYFYDQTTYSTIRNSKTT